MVGEPVLGMEAAARAGVITGMIWTSRDSWHVVSVVAVGEDAVGGAVVVYVLHPMHGGTPINQARPLAEFLKLFVRR